MEPASVFDALPQLRTATLVWRASDAPPAVYQAAQSKIDEGFQIEALVVGADADWVTLLADPLGDFVWIFDLAWETQPVTVAAVCSEITS